MKQFCNNPIVGEDSYCVAGKYVFKRYCKLIPSYLIAAILSTVIDICLSGKIAVQEIISNAILELSMLEGFGFTSTLLVGPGWFCSALLICSFVVYILLSWNSNKFTKLIAPISIMTIFGYMSQRVGHLNYWLKFENDTIISIALLRGFAEMCLGCICCQVCQKLKTEMKGKSIAISTTIELFSFLGISYVIFRGGETQLDFVAVFLIAILISSSFTGYSVWNKIFNNDLCRYLGKISMSIYLIHSVIGKIDWTTIFPGNWEITLFLYFLIVIVFSCIMTSFTDVFCRIQTRK